MSLVFRHAGHVDEHGVLRLRSVAAWRQAIARQRGRDVFVCIGRQAQPKTQDQMGYYRGVILPFLAESWGWEQTRPELEELHIHIKAEVIPDALWVERRIGDKTYRLPPSTADLTMEQFSEFLDAVIRWAAKQGVAVPEPRQVA